MNIKNTNSIEIKLKSYCKTTLHFYLKFINENILKENLDTNYIFLPTKKTRLTLLRSPHVYKKAKEQFENQLFSGLLKINVKSKNKILIHSKLKTLLLNKPKSILLKIKL